MSKESGKINGKPTVIIYKGEFKDSSVVIFSDSLVPLERMP